jgi:multidrug efflux pump subunit AcrB
MDSFVNMAYAMPVAIGLVYLILVILVRLLLVPMMILFALPLAVIVVTNAMLLLSTFRVVYNSCETEA